MILSIANLKGGVGKTTTAWHIAAAAAARGVRPLLIDLDSSEHLTTLCGGRLPHSPTICEVLGGATKPTHTLRQVQQYISFPAGCGYLVPSHKKQLENVAAGLMTKNVGRVTALRKALTREPHSDLVIIDTQPHDGVLTLNAFYASTHIVFCVEPEEPAIDGLYRAIDSLAIMAEDDETPPAIIGVIATKVDGVAGRHADNMARLMAPGMPPLLGEIPKRVGRDANKQLTAAYAPIAAQIIAEAGLAEVRNG